MSGHNQWAIFFLFFFIFFFFRFLTYLISKHHNGNFPLVRTVYLFYFLFPIRSKAQAARIKIIYPVPIHFSSLVFRFPFERKTEDEENQENEQLTPRRKWNNIQLLVLDSLNGQKDRSKRKILKIKEEGIRNIHLWREVSFWNLNLTIVTSRITKEHVRSRDYYKKKKEAHIFVNLVTLLTKFTQSQVTRSEKRNQDRREKGCRIRELTLIFLSFLLFVLQ